jgi:hypothetical protein
MRHDQVIQQWPTTAEFSSDLGEPLDTVRAWKRRNSIPPRVWRKLVAAARRRGLSKVTWEALGAGAEIATEAA